MIPVFQKYRDPVRGDCLSACLASLFHLKLEDVPHFAGLAKKGCSNEDWWRPVYMWLAQRGWGLMHVECDQRFLATYDGYLLVAVETGVNTNAPVHETIWRNGQMVHDPLGPVTDDHEGHHIRGVDLLYPLDASRLVYIA